MFAGAVAFGVVTAGVGLLVIGGVAVAEGDGVLEALGDAPGVTGTNICDATIGIPVQVTVAGFPFFGLVLSSATFTPATVMVQVNVPLGEMLVAVILGMLPTLKV